MIVRSIIRIGVKIMSTEHEVKGNLHVHLYIKHYKNNYSSELHQLKVFFNIITSFIVHAF